MIEIIDRSTSTGLRVQIFSGTTNTVVNLTSEEWEELKQFVRSGQGDDIATAPIEPFIH